MRKEVLVLAFAIVLGASIIGYSLSNRDDEPRSAAEATASSEPADSLESPAKSPAGKRPAEEIAEEPKTVEVHDYGFGIDSSYGDRTASFAIVVQNPSPDYFIEQVELGVVFYDRSGTVVGSQEEYATWLGPKAKAAVHGSLQLPGNVEAVRMDVEPGAITQALKAPDRHGAFQVGAAILSFEYGTPTATATIHSTFADDIADAYVVAVFYDGDDKIVGGGFTFEKIRSGTRTIVKVDGLYKADGATRAEVYVTPSSLSDF
jgi:hypothetical protein